MNLMKTTAQVIADAMDAAFGERTEFGIKDAKLTAAFEAKFGVTASVFTSGNGAVVMASPAALATMCRHFGFKAPSYITKDGPVGRMFFSEAKVRSI